MEEYICFGKKAIDSKYFFFPKAKQKQASCGAGTILY